MTRAAAAFALAALCAACARHGNANVNANMNVNATAVSGPSATAAPSAPPAVPPSKTVLAILAPTPEEGEVLLRVGALRAHPLGARLEPFVAAWPGWRDTLEAFAPHPLTDLEWIDVVGPANTSAERMLARTAGDDDAFDVRIEALATGSTESAKPLVDAAVSHAAAARVDGLLRVVARAEPHLVVASPTDTARGLTRALAAARVTDPEGNADEILRADLPHPHAAIPLVPEEVRRVRAHVFARPGGAAEAVAELACDDDAAAQHTAAALQALVDQFDNAIVRMLTHDLLANVSIEVARKAGTGAGDGSSSGPSPVVTARISASREQLESLLPLAMGLLVPRPSSARAEHP